MLPHSKLIVLLILLLLLIVFSGSIPSEHATICFNIENKENLLFESTDEDDDDEDEEEEEEEGDASNILEKDVHVVRHPFIAAISINGIIEGLLF